MVRLTFALLPSPLLSPQAWGPVAQVLRSGGWSVLEQAGAAEPPGAPGGGRPAGLRVATLWTGAATLGFPQ
ncbi:MAG: hypothetical protein ABWZ30_06245, partial [Jiangellaceae bacterium]